MKCEAEEAKVLAKGALSEREAWSNWQIVRCPGEKPALWVIGNQGSSSVYTASKSKLEVLGFIDGASPARNLEDIGSKWRISAGTYDQKQPIWLLREGKNTLVFIDASREPFQVLGMAKAGCGRQIDIDPGDNAWVVTIRKPNHGDIIKQYTWNAR